MEGRGPPDVFGSLGRNVQRHSVDEFFDEPAASSSPPVGQGALAAEAERSDHAPQARIDRWHRQMGGTAEGEGEAEG